MSLGEFILSIVASLIAAFIFQFLQGDKHIRFRGLPPAPPGPIDNIAMMTDHREENRRRVRDFFQGCLLRFVTFYSIYICISAPLVLKAMFSHNVVVLSDARFIGLFLPEIPINGQWIQLCLVLIAIALYLPISHLVRKSVALFESFFGFRAATAKVRFTVGCYLSTGALLAVATTYLYYQVSFIQAVSSVMFVVCLGAMSASK